jgi:hypothetical protein
MVYTFSELSPAAQKKAIEKWRKIASENFDATMLTENFQQILEEKGLPDKDIRWSLSSSQGDGVAFYGTFDIVEYIKKNKLTTKYKDLMKVLPYNFTSQISRRGSHHYDHYNTMEVDIAGEGDYEMTPAQEALLKQLHDHIAKDIVEVSKKLEKIGYDEIEYQQSEEQAREYLGQDDDEFDESGKRI